MPPTRKWLTEEQEAKYPHLIAFWHSIAQSDIWVATRLENADPEKLAQWELEQSPAGGQPAKLKDS